MVQLASAAVGGAPATNSHVPNMKYAYDVVERGGRAIPTIKVDDIAGAVAANGIAMFDGIKCKVDTGALISSAAGGVVEGFDMYGQFMRETIAAAGTGTLAFAYITSWPADALWVNAFGLPYKFVSSTQAGITYTAHSADTDERGTFVVDGGVTAPTEVTLDYIADTTNLMGDAYASRYASVAFDNDNATIVGTINMTTGAVSIDTAVVADAGDNLTFFFPDGAVVTVANAAAAGAVARTMNALWFSKYKRTLPQDNIDDLISFRGSNANVTGYVNLTAA